MSNDIIRHISKHRSVRSYTQEHIDEKIIEDIIKAGQMAPSSINGQQVSVIIIKDKQKKVELAKLAGNQPWVEQAPVFFILAMDFHRASIAAEKWNRNFDFVKSSSALLTGALDCGLFMQNCINAAEGFGLGTVPIGGIHLNIDKVAKLLELPSYVFPIVGLCLGYPQYSPGQKPRFPYELIAHNETYNQKNIRQHIDIYDDILSTFLEKIDRVEQEINWSHNTSAYYQNIYAPKETETLKSQGFDLE